MNTTAWKEQDVPEPMTTWHNPMPFEQSIVVSVPCHIQRTGAPDEDGKRRTWIQTSQEKTITWAPGETRSIPSKFDRVPHIVTGCQHEACRKGRCSSPGDAWAKASVTGGAAPLLQRVPQVYGLDPSLLSRPALPQTVAIPADQVASRLAASDDAEPPGIQRARARRAAGK